MKKKIVEFLTKIKNHFVKHKQRYMRVLLVILCVYLVLLALCSIGRCTRKNVITADALELGDTTNLYFEVPVYMPYNSATSHGAVGATYYTHSYVLSNPLFLRLSRNLDFLGVSSITSDGGSEFIPVQSSTLYSYDGVGCTYVKGTFSSSFVPETLSVDCRVEVRYVDRIYGAYPAITQCNVIPVQNSNGVFDTFRFELVNWSEGSSTLICAFVISAKTFDKATPFIFLGSDVSYSFSVSDSYANGYASGREAGYNEGYSRGYSNGSQTVSGENQFTALMNAIVFVPINTLWNVLNFEFLGVNVFMFVTAVITVLVVIWLWGKLK